MTKLGRPKKRRTRTQHTGVKLFQRARKKGSVWCARWVDPDTLREKEVSLNSLGLTNDEARRVWCIARSKTLMERRAALVSGAPTLTRTNLDRAVEGYFDAMRAEGKRLGTLNAYSDGVRPFVKWCATTGVRFTEDLNGARLEAFRKWWVSLRAKVSARAAQGGRGAKVQGTRLRSPHYINKGLRAVRTMLGQWRRDGVLRGLDSDAIRDHLRMMRAPMEAPRFLRSLQIRALLQAAQRHDAHTWKETRAEHAGLGPKGNTPRYRPIFPFVATCLLTGCRYAEVAGLRWDEVALDTGEIYLAASRTKTARARRVALNITPGLWQLLREMKLQSAGQPFVFGGDCKRTRNDTENAHKRLMKSWGAPRFSWQDLRRTCGTFLACAPGIYAGAGAFHAAKRLGHSVLVSERHYAGAVTDIPVDAQTVEAAMGIADLLPSPTELATRASITIQTQGNVMERGALIQFPNHGRTSAG